MQNLTARIQSVAQYQGLEAAWRKLETKAARSFFHRWEWIATAIGLYRDNLLVAEISSPDEIVALGLFSQITETRNGVVRSRQARLFEAGAKADTTVEIEFNTLLAAPSYELPAWDALLSVIDDGGAPGWDEIVITNALAGLAEHFEAAGRRVHRRAQSGSGFVDLVGLRAAGVESADAYIATLGKSTRSQLKRSIRLYGERGPLTLKRAASRKEAFAILDDIIVLHEQKWRARGERGLGGAKHLVDFQRRLIERTLPAGGVELVQIAAGGEPFACVYNFIDGENILFNVGGFKLEEDNRLKPGLVAHTLLVESHLQSGKAKYDFLAGDARYKLSLGQPGPDFVSFAIQRDKPIFRIENALRSFKSAFIK